jgi:hypothetical protein
MYNIHRKSLFLLQHTIVCTLNQHCLTVHSFIRSIQSVEVLTGQAKEHENRIEEARLLPKPLKPVSPFAVFKHLIAWTDDADWLTCNATSQLTVAPPRPGVVLAFLVDQRRVVS